eukprot:12006341-Alexandrium_andersonii.AAC.1
MSAGEAQHPQDRARAVGNEVPWWKDAGRNTQVERGVEFAPADAGGEAPADEQAVEVPDAPPAGAPN